MVEKSSMRLSDWARLTQAHLDAVASCQSFSTLFGVRAVAEAMRICAGNNIRLEDVPPNGAGLQIDLTRPRRNGHAAIGYLVVSQPLHPVSIVMVARTPWNTARFVRIATFQYLTTLKLQGVSYAHAVAAIYDTLHAAATVEDRERFVRFITAIEDFHRVELAPRLAPFVQA
ncbi:MAG: hypothetical protein Q7S52_00795 [bacterium]|nr:hypothetical protein [bacterium]